MIDLEVSDDFLNRMDSDGTQKFYSIQADLTDVVNLVEDLPDNEYKQLALDSLKLCILSVAESLTEPE